jgi:flagellar basal body-associated protein FliL
MRRKGGSGEGEEAVLSPMLASNRLARVALALNFALVLFAVHLARGRRAPAATIAPEPPAHPTVPLAGSLVHLLRGETDSAERHASIQLDLELEDRKDLAMVAQHMPMMREAVLSYFSDRTAREIKAPGSLARIKEDLLPRLNRALPAPRIRVLYITQIVVQ